LAREAVFRAVAGDSVAAGSMGRTCPLAVTVASAANPIIAKWEALMWGFQQPIPWAKPGEKWVLMDRIFKSGL
jgi:hypothetical protein